VARLAIGRDDDHEEQRDGGGDPPGEVQERDATECQHKDDFLSGVRHRGQRVGAEHRQREALGEQRFAEPLGAHRPADEPAFRNVEHDSIAARPAPGSTLADGALMPAYQVLTKS
jgi:hypothetical protein